MHAKDIEPYLMVQITGKKVKEQPIAEAYLFAKLLRGTCQKKKQELYSCLFEQIYNSSTSNMSQYFVRCLASML